MDIRAHLTMDMIAYNDPAGADLWIEGFYQGTSSVWLMNQLDVNARTYCGLSTYHLSVGRMGFGPRSVPQLRVPVRAGHRERVRQLRLLPPDLRHRR